MYQRRLASCSRDMLRSVRQSERWLGLDLNFSGPDFEHSQDLRAMTVLCRSASSLRMDLPQLARLLTIPTNVRLHWSPCQHFPAGRISGFFASTPLLGVACFALRVQSGVTKLQLGARDFYGFRRTYVRVDQICSANPKWYFGVAGREPSCYEPASANSLIPNQWHEFVFRWSQRFLSITLDDTLVAAGLLQPGEVSGAPPLAKFFLYGVTNTDFDPASIVEVRARPSPVMRNAKIRCAICDCEYVLEMSRWCLCPNCNAWVCARHVSQNPFRWCPMCSARLQDFEGGADNVFLPQEILLRLPEYFFSPSYLRSLAACSKESRGRVLQSELWRDKDLFLNDKDMQTSSCVRQMERLWSMARTIICTQTQLVSMREMSLKALIEWKTAPAKLDGIRHASIESRECLLGSARFLLCLSADIRAVYVGVNLRTAAGPGPAPGLTLAVALVLHWRRP